jgi:DNA-binding CsgD family transcriptional regulator
MDLATLYFFINFFKTIRPIALLYAGISSSLFLGEYLLSLLLQNRDYYLASFQFFSLFSLLFFYKAYLKEQKTSSEKEILEGTFPEETEKPNILALPYKGALDPESLRDKLNSKVPPHAKRLTLRECEVLFYYVIEEKNLVEISTLLGLSRSSVREYLRRASFKLGTSPQEIRDFL